MTTEDDLERMVDRMTIQDTNGPTFRSQQRVAIFDSLRQICGGTSDNFIVGLLSMFMGSGYETFTASTAKRVVGYALSRELVSNLEVEEWPWLRSATLTSLCLVGTSMAKVINLLKGVWRVDKMFSAGKLQWLVPAMQCFSKNHHFLSEDQLLSFNEMTGKLGDPEVQGTLEAIRYHVTRPHMRKDAQHLWVLRDKGDTDAGATCVAIGKDENVFFAAVGLEEPFTGFGSFYDDSGELFYRGDFDDGQPHGSCSFLFIEEKNAVFSGSVVDGEPCGRGRLVYGCTDLSEEGLFDSNLNLLDGLGGFDKDGDPGYQKFTLRLITAQNEHQGMYKMDTGMGDATYCDADEAVEYHRALKRMTRKNLQTRAAPRKTAPKRQVRAPGRASNPVVKQRKKTPAKTERRRRKAIKTQTMRTIQYLQKLAGLKF